MLTAALQALRQFSVSGTSVTVGLYVQHAVQWRSVQFMFIRSLYEITRRKCDGFLMGNIIRATLN